jgi:PAS domain S-box-containing protein
MTSEQRSSRPSAFTPTYTSLAALSAVASSLNSGAPIDETVPRILAVVQEQLRGHECALWLSADAVFSARWSASGTTVTTGAEVADALAAGNGASESGLMVVPLESRSLRLGALSLRRPHAFLIEERLLMATLANFLTPFLQGAEQSRQLAAEVAQRTLEIEEQRRFTSQIIDSLPVGLYVIDSKYRIQAWNKKRETGMQGVKRDEVMGRTIFDVLHRQDAGDLRREFDEVFATGSVQQFHTESSSLGAPRVFRVSKIPMRLGGQGVSHVITIGEDITDWKEATDRMSQADKLSAIGQLAAGVMHEINNPLATIAACSESLALLVTDMRALGYAMNTQFQEYLGIIESEVHRCKRIVDGLLEFSHPRALSKERVVLDEVVEQSLFLIKHHAKFKRMVVARDLLAGGRGTVVANRDQLVRSSALVADAFAAGAHAVLSRDVRPPALGAVISEIACGRMLLSAQQPAEGGPAVRGAAPAMASVQHLRLVAGQDARRTGASA